jgi:hypothetical protein
VQLKTLSLTTAEASAATSNSNLLSATTQPATAVICATSALSTSISMLGSSTQVKIILIHAISGQQRMPPFRVHQHNAPTECFQIGPSGPCRLTAGRAPQPHFIIDIDLPFERSAFDRRELAS